MTGRKRIFDARPDKVETLLNYLQLGMYVKEACALAGISTSSYYAWIDEAESLDPGDDPTEEDIQLLDFLDSVKRARAEAEAFHLQNVRNAGDSGSWQASAWWLERSSPEKWGRKERVEVTGKEEGPIIVEIEFGD